MIIFYTDDRELIVAQCNNQKATRPEDVAGFALAYANAKIECSGGNFKHGVTQKGIEDSILSWGELIDFRNRQGWRCVPVTFANGNSGLSPNLIQRAMEQFCSAFAEGIFPAAIDVYREFERIHPFLDGNGRVGHLLYAVYNYMQNREWPSEPPPDIFAK